MQGGSAPCVSHSNWVTHGSISINSGSYFSLCSLSLRQFSCRAASLQGKGAPVFLTETGDTSRSRANEQHRTEGGTSHKGGGAMDLSTLPWADRERILKLLFSKINNQAQQQHFANLPPHVLGDAAAQ